MYSLMGATWKTEAFSHVCFSFVVGCKGCFTWQWSPSASQMKPLYRLHMASLTLVWAFAVQAENEGKQLSCSRSKEGRRGNLWKPFRSHWTTHHRPKPSLDLVPPTCSCISRALSLPLPFLTKHSHGKTIGGDTSGRKAIKKDARRGQITLFNWRFWYLWCIITRDQACSPALLGDGRLLRGGDQKNTALLFGKENWMGNNWNLERTVRKMSFQLGFKV